MERVWVTSDLPESHTALWDTHVAHEGNVAHVRGGEVMQVARTPHVEAQLKAGTHVRLAKDAEIEAAKKDRRAEAKAEAQSEPAG